MTTSPETMSNNPKELSPAYQQLATQIFDIGAVKFGAFKVKKHDDFPEMPPSPVYIDLRILQRFPEAKAAAVDVYQELLAPLKFDLIAGIPTAAIGFASSLSDKLHVGQVTPRLDSKKHGSGAKVDGLMPEDKGKTAVAVDDLITHGKSKFEAIDVLREAEVNVNDVVVLVDREQGGQELAQKISVKLHAAFTMNQMLDFYVKQGKISAERRQEIKDGIVAMDAYIAQKSTQPTF